jgi:hypothetical protein
MESLHSFGTRLLSTLFLVLCASPLFAQQGFSIRGSSVDTTAKTNLAGATVYVLNAKDSIMQKFTYTTQDGSFTINGLPSGNFILLETYPEHADYAEKFTLSGTHPTQDFGIINMPLKARLLEEVIISGTAAIKIKGDTTEFNAKAYVIQPNDKVEDLIRQLPGLQVDKDGKITANGERVTKVLLDGEEFFGDDPALVTRNIRANMVDKIQLYDKKSDQATFTGVDDGSKTKTLNVKLKADQNKGQFGKIEAIAGTENIYSGQGLFNSFKPGQKYSAYATAADNGKISLGMADNSRLGSSGNNVQIGDVVIIPLTTDEQDGFNGTYNGKGLPVARTGGAHYDGKWNEAKESVNANYKAGYLGVRGFNTLLSEQNLPSGVINNNNIRNYDNSAFRQKLDAAYTVKLDSLSDLKITADGTIKNTSTFSADSSSTFGSSLLNRNNQTLDNNSDLTIFNTSAFYSRKFHKAGRTFSWNLGQAFNRNNSTGFQNSTIEYFNLTGTTDSTRHIDQYKKVIQSSSVLSSNMIFSEALSKTFAIIFNYGIGVNNSRAGRRTYDPALPGVYTRMDSVYSNDYKFNQLTNQVGAIFNYHRGNVLLNFGTKASQVDFKQIDEFSGTKMLRSFMNWAPQANFQYRASQQKSLSLSYNGTTTQPVIDQIQPVRVNTDPLNIVLGNPDLKPSFNNSFSVRYRSFQPISGRFINFGGNYGFTSSAIITDRFTDASGKSTIRYRNLNSEIPFNYSLFTVVGFKIKPIGASVEVELGASGNQGYYSNNELNIFKSHSYRGSVWIQKNVQKRYNLSLIIGPDYTRNRFSLQQYSNNSRGLYLSGSATVYLPRKFQMSSDFNYNYTSASQTFSAQNRSNWNASFGRTFLKNDALKLSVSGNDLLNQNLNFSRNISPNGITQNSYNSIQNYYMVSLSWDFGKLGANPVKK